VIIGAGIIGLSVAYYLKRKQCPRVLLLEKEDSWITGSTARANGGFRQQFSTLVNIRLSQISLPVFQNFTEEFDTDISFRQYGYLFLTATEKGEQGLRRNLQLQKVQGVPVEWVTPEEILQIAPFVKVEDLRGGTFCPADGYADSYSIAEGFGRKARDLGAQIEVGQPVVEILTASGQIKGVAIPGEEIHAPRVVNAAGPYASTIGKMAGVDVPVQPVRRMLVMTEDFPAIPEKIPMTIDADSGFLMRKESGKVLMGWSDPSEPPGFNLTFDPAFIDIVAQKALARVPLLEQARINPRRSWAGLYEVTPDHHCILGEAPELTGFFLANGFSGHGMMHSPAAGMMLADLILEGKTEPLDLHPVRLARFKEGDLIEETVVL
ncbi:FAD-binding oxidoreductase, partial [Acidobacteria bacterium AH-259-A15]|nr:FAD-binding oxidoreductase [Acidobacteria bacterium AH-259-A15]